MDSYLDRLDSSAGSNSEQDGQIHHKSGIWRVKEKCSGECWRLEQSCVEGIIAAYIPQDVVWYCCCFSKAEAVFTCFAKLSSVSKAYTE